MPKSVVKCVLCGHTRSMHADGEQCTQPVKVSYTTTGKLDTIVTCNCPKMTYGLVSRLIVKVDYQLDRRVSEYLQSIGGNDKDQLPNRSEVIREALKEYLTKRGF